MKYRRRYPNKDDLEFSDSEERIYIPEVTYSSTSPASRMDNTSNDANKEISEDVIGHRKSTRATSTDIEADNKGFRVNGWTMALVAVVAVTVYMLKSSTVQQIIVDEAAIIEKVTLELESKFKLTDINKKLNDNKRIQTDFDSTIKSIGDDVKSGDARLEKKLVENIQQYEEKSKGVEDKIVILKDYVGVEMEVLQKENNQKHESMLQNMTSQHDEVNKRISKLVETQKALKNQEKRIQHDMETQLKESKSLLNETVVEMEKTFKSLSDDLTQVLENKESIDETLNGQNKVLSVIRENTFNKAAGIFAIMLLFLLVIVLFILVCGKQKNERTDAAIPALPNGYVDYNTTAANTHLPYAITVVSFDDETQKQHKELMKAITTNMNTRLNTLPIRYHVIYRHDNIVSIPPSKLSFMFADFTERHVIIEQTGLGLGDLKRKTYEKIRALQSDLVIIYVKDPGSRRINRRFNPNIDCVTSQPELKVVNDRHRFFSVYDNFSVHQLQSLTAIIEETFDD